MPEPTKRPQRALSVLEAIAPGLTSRVATFAPGTVVGAWVYFQTGQVWQALLLACFAGPPTVAAQKVIAKWIELLEPPKRWRRPRRRGS